MAIATAKVVAHSIYVHRPAVPILTFEIEMPRIILAELNTHKMLSKNTSSSRAIPANTMLQQLETNMFIPEYWGKNMSGMQAKEELNEEEKAIALALWIAAGRCMITFTEKLQQLGLHKQLTNRISEAFQYVRVCLSGTDWANFYWLRDHGDAQPEIQAVARAMIEAKERSEVRVLSNGEWHVPYYKGGVWTKDDNDFTLEQALKISTSCCAQTSFRKNDDTIEKAERLFGMFFESDHIHASPAEHQATPIMRTYTREDMRGYPGINIPFDPNTWQEGITHVTRDGTLYSANLRGWTQHRQHLPNHVKKD